MIESPNTLLTFLSFAFTFATGFKKVIENHRIAGYVDDLQAWALERLKLDKDSISNQMSSMPKTLAASPGAKS